MEDLTWIKLYRKFTKWEWYDDINTKCLFIHLLLMANHKDKNWRGILIKRGQRLTGRKVLSVETGLSEMQIRTALDKLKSTKEITIKSTKKYSIITLLKYDNYQGDNQQITNNITKKQPSDNQVVTTNKNEKNDKNEKEVVEKNDDDFFNLERVEDGKRVNKKLQKELVSFYEKFSGGMSVNQVALDYLLEFQEVYGIENVKKAIEIAFERGKLNFGYIKGILKNEKENGYSWKDKKDSEKENPMLKMKIQNYFQNTGRNPAEETINKWKEKLKNGEKLF